MRTKKDEILKMTKEELISKKAEMMTWVGNMECSSCSNCWGCEGCSHCFGCLYCYDCSHCSVCLDCSDCWGCKGLTNKQYWICNVQLSKEEYEMKIKELKGEK